MMRTDPLKLLSTADVSKSSLKDIASCVVHHATSRTQNIMGDWQKLISAGVIRSKICFGKIRLYS